jgi:RND family efflux transporter MFP subunit
MRHHTKLPLLALLALLLSLSLAACKKDGEGDTAAAGGAGGGGGAPQGPPPVAVVVKPAELRQYAPAIELLGEIRAKQRATLAAEVSGKVTRVSRRVGETAPKGQALISIDQSTYSASLAAAQANLAQAQQQLAEAQAGPRTEVIAAQESAVAAARARYDAARDNLERQQQLYAEGVVSEATIVTAQSQADAAQAALTQEQRRLEELQTGTRPEVVAAARARVDAAASAVTLAQLSLQRTTIAPPFTALVSQLMVEEGQFVGPGTPLAEVVSVEGEGVVNEAWFNLPEAQARRVRPGASVELRADALAQPGGNPPLIKGTVASVAPAADAVTRQFPVRITVDDPRLRPGMTVRGRILTTALKPTLMIPADATTQSTLGLVAYKMVPPAGDAKMPTAQPVNIEIGENVDDYIVLAAGELQAGEMVVTRGKEQLYPGANIIPTNLAPPPGAESGDAKTSDQKGGAAETETKQ